MILRPATLEDSKFLRDLRNDPAARMHSVNSGPVTQAEHEVWLDTALHSGLRQVYVATVNTADDLGVEPCTSYASQIDIPIGTGRLHLIGSGVAELSLTVDPEWRGHGYGKEILRLLIDEAAKVGAERCYAVAHVENVASLIAFLKAGFVIIGFQQTVDGRRWVSMERGRG